MKRLFGMSLMLAVAILAGCDDDDHRHVSQTHHSREVHVYHERSGPRYHRESSRGHREVHHRRRHMSEHHEHHDSHSHGGSHKGDHHGGHH